MTNTTQDTVKVSTTYRVAVQAKYLAPTNNRGTRIKVFRADGGNTKDTTLTVGWDYSVSHSDNYMNAIAQYLDQMDWHGEWSVGTTETGAIAVCVKAQ